METGEAQR